MNIQKLKFVLLGCFYFLSGLLSAQTVVSGQVTDSKGVVLPGANVYLKDTYDGATTDSTGKFRFSTSESGSQTLVASYVSYEKFQEVIELNGGEVELNPSLKEEFSAQNTVLITAGGFGANDQVKAIVLEPLDIVTTAGAAGDVYGALQYLPGTQSVGEENGLFVRGGAASETVTIIDEMVVQQPFFSSVPDIPSRSRFNPFLFKGTFFSTGAYSARYGQALSSALILNTTDLPDTTSSGINLMLAGFGGFHSHKWKRTSVAVSANYADLRPMFLINKQAPDWEKPPRSLGTSVIFRHKPSKSSIIKLHSSYNNSRFVVKNPDPFNPAHITRTDLKTQNLYTNLSYRNLLNDKTVLFVGASHSYDLDDLDVDSIPIQGENSRTQAKAWISRSFSKNNKFWVGGESHLIQNGESFDVFERGLKDYYNAAFVETEVYLSPKVALRLGGRVEHSSLLGRVNAAPRASFAVKAGKYGSVSMATGQFYQNPTTDYTFNDPQINFERADHYLANYTWTRKNQTFRVEAYAKNYANLVRSFADTLGGTSYDNSGTGYARGVDFFWRDKETIKNGDYWISYSFLDTRRLYQDFPVEAQPYFASNHNLSLVYKHFFTSLRTAFGASYNYASGRPYVNPNLPAADYLSERTPDYHLVSLNASYLTTIADNFTVIFVSLGNVLGRNNVFGYRYSPDGTYRIPVNPPQKRSIFFGIFISIK